MEFNKQLIVCFHNAYLTLNPEMFTKSSGNLGDNLLSPNILLYQKCLENNIQPVVIEDVKDNLEQVSIFVFYDLPDMTDPIIQKIFKLKTRKVLFLAENQVVRPDNYDKNRHYPFVRIYTYRDDIVDGKLYHKYYNALDLPEHIEPNPNFNDLKLCTLINSAKMIQAQGELYSWRLEAIRFFQNNHPLEFDLYGRGWDKDQFPSYQGEVDSKADTYKKYKFSICYENSSHSGYLSEKIFDALKNGNIPVVMACENVGTYIPLNCFIHLRDFATYDKLYEYLLAIDNKKYLEYIYNINKYLKSEQIKPFKTENYVDWFINELKNIPEKKYLECPSIEPKIPNYEYKQYDDAPLVSVIIPTYNRNKFLPDAIKSVLAQTIQDFEIIICNDGGEDISDIVNSFNDNRIIHLINLKNSGVSTSRNNAINKARGRYIAFLDSDDVFKPYHFETLLSTLKNSEYKVAYTDAYRVTQSKQPDGSYKSHQKDLIYSIDYDPKMLLVQNLTPIQCVMFERELLEETGLFDENLDIYEDHDLLIRLSLRQLFCHIPRVTSEYSWRSDGSTTASSKKTAEKYSTYVPTIYNRYQHLCSDEILAQQDQILEIRNVSRII